MDKEAEEVEIPDFTGGMSKTRPQVNLTHVQEKYTCVETHRKDPEFTWKHDTEVFTNDHLVQETSHEFKYVSVGRTSHTVSSVQCQVYAEA